MLVGAGVHQAARTQPGSPAQLRCCAAEDIQVLRYTKGQEYGAQ